MENEIKERKVGVWGGTSAIRLGEALGQLGIAKGDTVTVEVSGDSVVIKKGAKKQSE